MSVEKILIGKNIFFKFLQGIVAKMGQNCRNFFATNHCRNFNDRISIKISTHICRNMRAMLYGVSPTDTGDRVQNVHLQNVHLKFSPVLPTEMNFYRTEDDWLRETTWWRPKGAGNEEDGCEEDDWLRETAAERNFFRTVPETKS